MTETKQYKEYKNKVDIGSSEIYQKYITSLDSIEKKNFVYSQTELNSAIHSINRKLMLNLIEKNIPIKMPYSLGEINIVKSKPKVQRMKNGNLSMPIDYKSTNELWAKDPIAKENRKYIYFRNTETGGYVFKFFWNKRRAKVNQIKSYLFVPVKQIKRDLAQVVKNPLSKVDFYEIKYS